jgi:hypothetical protein
MQCCTWCCGLLVIVSHVYLRPALPYQISSLAEPAKAYMVVWQHLLILADLIDVDYFFSA